MAPVCLALEQHESLRPVLISTGQHAELVDSALASFGLEPDEDLDLMTTGQTPNSVAARVLEKLPRVMEASAPTAVLVQGDTTTALAASLVAFHLRIPVGHIEAGLRTFDLASPFPEEANRQLADRLARWCFAPTERARRNLLAEGILPDRIHVCGNTAVDAVHWMASRCPASSHKDAVLLTLHRRESFGEPLLEILRGVRDFLGRHPEAKVVWPVHPNPRVVEASRSVFGEKSRFECLPPQGYKEFVALLKDCRLALSDSGGIQEEAPSLGKRVLVARDATERPEAVEAGLNWLVGRARAPIAEGLSRAWAEEPYRGALPRASPYGDGQASQRIVATLAESLDSEGRQ